MKKPFTLIIISLFSICTYAQNLTGSWQTEFTLDTGETIKNIFIFSDNYMVNTFYNKKTSQFISTQGGIYNYKDNFITVQTEFNSQNSDLVGKETKYHILLKENSIQIVNTDVTFERIDNGKQGELAGAWIFFGRKLEDGNIQSRTADHSRKTMKVLTGSKFQWIAFDGDKKQFMGTGGGSYTSENGQYIETIEFFSRDNSRVGAELQFNFELIDGEWHHSGLSSKGDPIYEIWKKRN